MKEVAIYVRCAHRRLRLTVRVSTNEQDPEMQLSDLRRYTKQRGFRIYKEYVDVGGAL